MLCSDAIGVFDSGLGGISVLKAIKRELPHENLIYFADKNNAPYGTKSDTQILQYTRAGAHKLLACGAKAIVIACNTATSVAASALRAELDVSVIGLEPAIKSAFFALKASVTEKILVLATPVTLSHPKFNCLLDILGRESFISIPAPELVGYIETGMRSREAAVAYLKKILAPCSDIRFFACVLGCTHFPFAKREITEALGYQPVFFDGADGAARELRRQLARLDLLNSSKENGKITWLTEYPANIHKRLFYGNI